ncbi:TRAP transporter substrate-binding protein [Paucidesulfovibrio longus]|uniref:TRAP transporter substrate-binding protein n=1 Tax=Paucidesulfovibrio longus TaxID=889 RepID=UPI0003B2E55A|nr:TRAP transporter substrate-binding protein [Paucidesulfovibrio longus]
MRWQRLFLLVLTLVLLAPALPSQAGPIKLSYSCFFPPTHVQSQLAEAWCREVEKRTDGKVQIDYYPGGTLTKANQCYDGVVEGISDIGFSALAYSRGRFPVMAAVDLPLGYTSGMAATELANAVYAQFKPGELDDVKVMYFNAHGPGLLHTKGKPVRTLEDIAGLKLRATGNSALLVQALGATPVAQSMPDAYQSIQKGVVDGGMYPVETNKGWKMAEVVDYMTENYSTAYTTTFFVVMNKDRWAELPADVQAAITEVNAEWIAKHGKAWDDSDVAGRAAFLAEKDNQIIPLSEEESMRWKAAATPILDDYVKQVAAKGVDGKAVLEFTVNKLNELQK